MDPEEENGRGEVLRMFGAILPSLPALMFRLMGEFIRFKGTVDIAARTFNDELVSNGVDSGTARRLTEIYREAADVSKLASLL